MAIIIDVKAPRSDRTFSQFDKLHKKFLQIDKTIERWADSLDRAANAAQRLSSSLNAKSPRMPSNSSARNIAPRGPSGPKAPPKVKQQSPYDQFRYVDTLNRITGGQYQGQRNSMLQSVFQHYHGLAGQGDPDALKKLTSLLPKYHQMMAPQGSGMVQKVMQLIASTRVGFGAGGLQVSPLIGRIASVFGGSGGVGGAAGAAAKGGPVGMAISVGVTALAMKIQALSAVFGIATAKVRQFAENLALAGGTAQQSAQAQRMASINGLGSAGEASRRFQSGIQNGFGQAYAIQAGINPIGGVAGDMNYAEKFRKYSVNVMNSKTFDEARRKAEAVGMPELAESWKLSAGVKERVSRGAPKLNESETQAFADLQANVTLVSEKLQYFAVKAILPLVKGANWLLEKFEQLLDMLDRWAKWVADQLAKLGIGVNKSKTNQSKKVEEDHTKAMSEHARALRESRETLGGGRRAQESLPGRLNGFQLNDASVRNSIRWGVA